MEALENLRITATTKSEQAVAGLEALATTLERLKSSLVGLESGAASVKQIASSGKSLAKISPNIEATSQALVRLGQATNNLKYGAENMSKMAAAGKALSKLNLSKAASALQQMNFGMRGATDTSVSMGNSLSMLAVKIWAIYRVARLIANALAKVIELSNNYIEMLNLFSVAMGQYGEQAYGYAQKVSEALGIDPAQWMEQQAALMEIISGYGVAGDKAAIMSQQLTQLGYDLASLWNTDVQTAFTKIQSGITGQTRAVRSWGFDISAVTLAQTAETLGLEKSYDAMSQAEKASLRYYVLMTQITNMHGDMAKTINTPANQLRVLKAQLIQAGRAIGDLFIPMLNKVLPYVIAAAKAVRLLAQQIASLFGIDLPSVAWDTYTAIESVDDEFADTAGSIDSATGAAKKLKKTLLGIDEINMLNAPNESSGGGGGGGAAGGGDGSIWDNIDIPTYDFLEKFVGTQIDSLVEKLQNMSGIVEGIAIAGFGAWVTNLIGVGNVLKELVAPGLALAFDIVFNGILAYQSSGEGVEGALINALEEALVTGLSGVALSVFVGASGLTIALAASIVAQIVGLSFGVEKNGITSGAITQGLFTALESLGLSAAVTGSALTLMSAATIALGVTAVVVANDKHEAAMLLQKAYDDAFGDVVLTDDQIQSVVTNSAPLWTSIGSSVAKAFSDADLLKDSLETAFQKISAYGYEISVGFTLNDGELESFKNNLGTVVSDIQEYVHQKQYAIRLGLSLGEEITGESYGGNGVSEHIETTLASWALEMQQKTNEVFADGLLSFDEQELINNLTARMQRVYQIYAESAVEAQIAAFTMSHDGTGLTPESFKAMMDQWDALAEDTLIPALQQQVESTLQGLKANIKFIEFQIEDEGWTPALQALLDEANAQYQAYFDSHPMEIGKIQIETQRLEFATNTFSSALDSTASKESLESLLGGYFSVISSDIDSMVSGFIADSVGMIEIPEGTGAIINDMLEYILGTHDDWMEQAKFYRENAMEVPEAVKEGLTNTALWLSMSDDYEARAKGLNYLIGEMFSSDPSFMSALLTVSGTGDRISEALKEGLANNATYMYDAGTNLITLFSNGIEVGSLTATQDVWDNLYSIGIQAQNGFSEGLNTNLDAVGSTMVGGLYESMRSEIEATMPQAGTAIASGISYGMGGGSGNIGLVHQAFRVNILDKILEESKKNEPKFTKAGASLSSSFSSGMTGGDIVAGFKNKVSSFNPKDIISENTLTQMYNVGVNLGNSMSDGLASVSMPTFHLEWVEKSSSFLNALGALQWLKIKVPKISFYAQGGMPDTGELYMARENGISEMVGRIGNRAAVANNDQIVTAVTQGVASANETEVALLREQNNLLAQLLAKDNTAIISTNDIVNGMSRMNKRAGKTIVATGV